MMNGKPNVKNQPNVHKMCVKDTRSYRKKNTNKLLYIIRAQCFLLQKLSVLINDFNTSTESSIAEPSAFTDALSFIALSVAVAMLVCFAWMW